MASFLCTCPLPASIGDIDKFDCAQTFGLVNRIAFRRFNENDQVAPGGNTGGFSTATVSGDRFRLPVFLTNDYTDGNAEVITANPITSPASWTTLLNAVDVTKIAATPLFSNTEVSATDTIEVGGNDNTTPNGRSVVVGETFAQFSSMFKDVPSYITNQLRSFACESNIGAFFFDEREAAIVEKVYDPEDPSIVIGYNPFPIFSVFIGSIQFGGRTEQNMSNFKFNLDPSWDAELEVLDLGFSISSLI